MTRPRASATKTYWRRSGFADASGEAPHRPVDDPRERPLVVREVHRVEDLREPREARQVGAASVPQEEHARASSTRPRACHGRRVAAPRGPIDALVEPARAARAMRGEHARGGAAGLPGGGAGRGSGDRRGSAAASPCCSASRGTTARRTRGCSPTRSRRCASSRTRAGKMNLAARRGRRRRAGRLAVHAPRRRAQGEPAELRRRGGARRRANALYERFCGAPAREGAPGRDRRVPRDDGGRARERRAGHDPARLETALLKAWRTPRGERMADCLFCKIVEGRSPRRSSTRTRDVVAFEDIDPQAPVHLLVVPRKHIATLNDLAPEDDALAGKLLRVAATLAKQRGIADRGWRATVNVNRDAHQLVFHVHVHVMGGRIVRLAARVDRDRGRSRRNPVLDDPASGAEISAPEQALLERLCASLPRFRATTLRCEAHLALLEATGIILQLSRSHRAVRREPRRRTRERSTPSSARTAPARRASSTASPASTGRSAGRIRFDGRDISRLAPSARTALGIARTFQNIALFRGMTVLDNLLIGRHVHQQSGVLGGAVYSRPGAARGDRAPRDRRGHHRLPRDPARPQEGGRDARLRAAEAGRARPRARARAEAPPPRRADGGHERGGEGGHGALRRRDPRGARDHRRDDRARHGRRDGALATGSRVLNFGEKIAEGPPDEIRRNRDVQDAYLGEQHELEADG